MNLFADDRRRFPRLRLQVPLFVRGTDCGGREFLELAKTLDISATGAFLIIPCALRHDEMLSLTIPAPLPSSVSIQPHSTPPIQARVRRLESTGEAHLVGVEFLRPLD